MDETFKVPSLPVVDPKPDDDASESITSTEEVPHAPVMQPELPPADSAASVRHKNLQYDVPESSALPPAEYTLEVLRNGSIIDYISLSHRPYTVFGRSPDSDVVLEHPTISRYHAIVQYKSEFEHGQSAGLYLYDCGSTHGTFINKKRLEPKVYVRIKVDYIIKFGQSTRLYLVQGDSSADTDTSTSSTSDDVTHEQMKQFHAKRAKKLAIVRAKRENAANEASLSNAEMDWGMGPDAEETAAAAAEPVAVIIDKIREEEELTKKRTAIDDLRNRMEYQKARNDSAILQEIMTRVDDPNADEDSEAKKEPFYLKDPKRALMTFFEREGAELVYDVEDLQFGSYRCTIKLPIVDDLGRSMQAECEEKHCKRKEIIHRCILEACRILDEQGVLREGTSASAVNTPRVQQIKRQLLEENDFYEEDEDTFYDRTGELEKKRLKRMEWSGHSTQEKQVENFDSLCEKLSHLYHEQVDLEHKLEAAKEMEEIAAKNAAKADKDVDEVDLYIRQLKQGEKVNMKVKWQWKKRLLEMENEERQWTKLLKVCKSKEFEIPAWKQQVREQAKQKLTKKKFIPPPPPPPALPEVVPEAKPLVEKTQMLPPPPPPPLPISSSAERKSVVAEPKIEPSANSVPTKSSNNPRRKPPRASKQTKDQDDDSEHYSNEKFAEWMPPENEQTGDGRTALNEKYGY